MKRSASEIIRNLESRIAKLEKLSSRVVIRGYQLVPAGGLGYDRDEVEWNSIKELLDDVQEMFDEGYTDYDYETDEEVHLDWIGRFDFLNYFSDFEGNQAVMFSVYTDDGEETGDGNGFYVSVMDLLEALGLKDQGFRKNEQVLAKFFNRKLRT